MAKKKTTKSEEKQNKKEIEIPDETKKKLEDIKEKLEKYKDRVLETFDEYVLGIALLPPSKDEENKEKINVMILVDDTDSQKMSKEELHAKLSERMKMMAKNVDEALNPEVLILSELWQNCYDAKYDILQIIANSAPIYDKGMLQAIKLSEVHKSMVLKKFEKYIVSYVLAGSLVQGKATPESDIDVFIVIDDTDVKKMTRTELKDKLRAIIIGMGMDAGKMTGVENKINIQVYILTDFWENIKEANPVIFTFLRDGIPLYDRGIFMPWKQLLQMGRVKPSPEAIDMFMHTGDQMLDRVKMKLKEIAIDDFFWAILTPSQAALMMYGLPPPTPKETPEVLKQIFVKKEKLLEEKYVKILENVLKTRKEMEHGTKKDASGKEIDELYKNSREFLDRMKKLFESIEKLKEKEDISKSYEELKNVISNALEIEGKTTKQDKLIKDFNDVFVKKGIFNVDVGQEMKSIEKAKKEFDAGKLTKSESTKTIKTLRKLIRLLVEHIQRVKTRDLERAKVRIRYGNKMGEVLLLKDDVFLILDANGEQKEIQKGKMSKTGKITGIKKSSYEELEAAIVNTTQSEKMFIKPSFFEDLKEIFGKNVELLVNY